MLEFNATLLREKFIIQDIQPAPGAADKGAIIALSNRMAVPLASDDTEQRETYVIRAQNMHSCARMAAHLTKEFQEGGPIDQRSQPFDWAGGWDSIEKGYEEKWNPQRWIAVYHKGRAVFEAGPRHPFLDIIEQCDVRNKGEYEKSIEIARDAFRRAGKNVTITYDANVALILSVTNEQGRCGLIVRGPNRTTTFNFVARPKAGRMVRVSSCLSAAAFFLEGIQMCFTIGMVQYKLQQSLIDPKGAESKQGQEAGQKIGRLRVAIDQFEAMFDVTYRPERPDFNEMVASAEQFARKLVGKKAKVQDNRSSSADTQDSGI
jgi:hypothetical protein